MYLLRKLFFSHLILNKSKLELEWFLQIQERAQTKSISMSEKIKEYTNLNRIFEI